MDLVSSLVRLLMLDPLSEVRSMVPVSWVAEIEVLVVYLDMESH